MMTLRDLAMPASVLFVAIAAVSMGGAAGPSHPVISEADSPSVTARDVLSPKPLPFHYDLHTFRGDRGGTTVVAAVAVPAKGLRAQWKKGRIFYRIDIHFVLADTITRSVFSTSDSATVRLPRRAPGRHLLHTFVEVEAPPSNTTLQRVVVTDAATPGRGQLYTTPFRIPDYSGDELMLSDIALGLPQPLAGWTRPGSPLALLPTSEFPESAFDVYYEIYNLPEGTPYESEISIQRADDTRDDAQAVQARFSGEADVEPDGSVKELRLVESGLPRGRYRLTVTVTNMINGRNASRSRTFEVRGWRDGTTLVPALPKLRVAERG